uniref:Uncharacterized protein n=1 Tax=Zea mays TaxID=4577 RepID=C4J177_MAIZE|nr:unknown [Zea mays]
MARSGSSTILCLLVQMTASLEADQQGE